LAFEVAARYRGSLLGMLWTVCTPLLLLTVYTFVFGFVYQARWSGMEGGGVTFALVLFTGLNVFNLMAEALSRAPYAIVNTPAYVKKVVFPLEILPCVPVLAALFQAGVGFALLMAALALVQGLPVTALLVPVVLTPLLLLLMGLSWFLAALGVYVRDVAHLMGMVLTVALFLSPVFYPLSALPEPWRILLLANPLTLMVEETRAVLILGRLPQWGALAVYLGVAVVTGCLGFAWFQRTRKGFADVL
jgi:lipopolysaccharide transport system permease protein